MGTRVTKDGDTVMLRAAVLLSLVAATAGVLLTLVNHATRERIVANELTFLLNQLHTVLTGVRYDNDIAADVIELPPSKWSESSCSASVFRARQNGQPVAVVMTPTAPDGYNGSINLLVGIAFDGTLTGVRVVAHRETPGLGDAIEVSRSDWITQFRGRSLTGSSSTEWNIKRDGGNFDQLTGATITTRAVVRAVYECLQSYGDNRDMLYAPTQSTASPSFTPKLGLTRRPIDNDE